MRISSEKKKELKKQYQLLRPDMGLIAVINKSSSKHYLETARNLPGILNSTVFRLKTGKHHNRELQQDWQWLGSDGFEIKVLEKLDYDDDESKTDYEDDLQLLKMIWIEKLTAGDIPLY